MTMPYSAIELMRQRLNPRFFSRLALTAEFLAPDQAVLAGFLDQTVPAAEVVSAAQKLATTLTHLDLAAHAASKQRVRESTMVVLRKAIERDDAALRARI
jgi:enoyl-CoA hydratase